MSPAAVVKPPALTVACPTCKAPVDAWCHTVSGNASLEGKAQHIARVRLADQMAPLFTAHFDAGFAAGAASRDEEVAQLHRVLLSTEGQLDEALSKVEDLKAQLAAAVKPPVRTRFGACARKGDSSPAAVVIRYGLGAAVRIFASQLGAAVARPAGAGVVHVSCKEFDLADVASDAKVRATFANMLPGDGVEVIHESDNDGLDAAGVEARIELKNTFYDTVKRVRPDLLVVHTMTGWIYEPKSHLNPFVWAGKVKADVLAMDCDGVRPTALPYTNYEDETARIIAIVKDPANHYSWFAVPEFGCPRIPSADPDGKIRAAYHDHYAGLWSASGLCAWVTLYEWDSSPNYSLSTAAELSGWKAHVSA